jgi:tryptophan synthase alpha subunit
MDLAATRSWRALAAVADLVEVALPVADPRLDGEVPHDAHRETLAAGYQAGLMIFVQSRHFLT